MTEERIAAIERVIVACEQQGLRWTNLLIYEHVGGQYQQISRYLKKRRAMQCVAMPVPVDEDPGGWADEHPQDAPEPVQEFEECGVQACPLTTPDAPYEPPVPLPMPEKEDEPPAPAAVLSPPRPVPTLEALQQAAREADATLIRLTRERDVQQTVAQHAAWALSQAKHEAQRLARALRATVRQMQATRAPYQQEAQARAAELYAQLAELVGAADAERIAHDGHFAPPWLRG
jgi:hypothetical protein